MDPKEKSKLVKETPLPPAPDPETLKREKEKLEKERLEKEALEKPKTAGVGKGNWVRGPKSNLVKAAETEADKKRFEEKCRKAGESACDVLVMTGYTFLGPEFAYIPPFKINPDDPDSPLVDEKQRMRGAYGDMFVAYGWDVIPPWIPVLTVTGSYVAARLNMETVKQRMKGGLFSSLKERFKNIGKKKEPPRPPVGDEKPKEIKE